MKKWIVALSGSMLVVLLIASFVYVRTPNDVQNGLNAENKAHKSNIVESETSEKLYAEETIDYALAENQLYITFNKGKEWIEVPMKQNPLINDRGSDKGELADGSYLLSEERVAFLSTKEIANPVGQLWVNYSLDQGKTWHESFVVETFLGNRFWKLDFLDDQFGYLITTGEKVVGQEIIYVYITKDGGQSWQSATDEPLDTNLIAAGGFIDTKIGFLSVNHINPTEPTLLVTRDTGKTWDASVIEVPEEYHEIFVAAEMPYIEDDHLAVLINQGPNGDYKGAKVKGKFISTDQGATWHFSTEVEVDEY